MAVRYGEDFAGRRRPPTWRDDPGRRVDGALHRPGTCWARPRSPSRPAACGSSSRATTSAAPTRPACPTSSCPATCSSPRRPSACRSSAIRTRARRCASSSIRVALFPERAHIVGAYALGKAQRVMALLREEGYDRPIYLHGAMERLTEFYSAGHRARRRRRRSRRPSAASSPAPSCICPPSAIQDLLVAPLSRPGRPASPPAGCGCGRGPARRASSCRS